MPDGADLARPLPIRPASPFRLIAAGVDVTALNAELDAAPELWGQNGFRTAAPDSVHHGVPDIWLRWRPEAELTTPETFNEEHWPVFWPAWHHLPSLHPIVRNLGPIVGATALGGIIITRVPAGGEVKPHVDVGWHAKHYDTKLYLTLRANALCLNHCDGHAEHFREGDVWEFPNSLEHSVVNCGDTDRITAIICFRTA